MFCKTCHYSLVGLRGPEHRCPECQTAFNPNDPNSYLTEWQITLDRRQRLFGGVGMTLALLTIVIAAAVTSTPLVLLFMIPPIATVAILTWIQEQRRKTK